MNEPYLPTGVTTRQSGDIVPDGCGPPANGEPGCVVPEGHIFMIGDNRESSKDSRVFGPIDQETIVGRVFVRIWPPRRPRLPLALARSLRAGIPGPRAFAPWRAPPLRCGAALPARGRSPAVASVSTASAPLGDGGDHTVDVVAVHARRCRRRASLGGGAPPGRPRRRPGRRSGGTARRARASTRCDAGSSRRPRCSARSAAWRSSESADPVPARRVHEPDLGGDRAQRPQGAARGAAEPETPEIALVPARSSTSRSDPVVLQVDRELVVGPELAGTARPGVGRRGAPSAHSGSWRRGAASAPTPARRTTTTGSCTSTTSPSPAVQASVSRPSRPGLEGVAEGREGVLGMVGAGAPMGEGDRARPDRRAGRLIRSCSRGPRGRADTMT